VLFRALFLQGLTSSRWHAGLLKLGDFWHPQLHAGCRFIKEQKAMQKYIDIEAMLRKWFDGVELSDIYRENVADLLVYGFWFMSRWAILETHLRCHILTQ
jgi:hypothetical protein